MGTFLISFPGDTIKEFQHRKTLAPVCMSLHKIRWTLRAAVPNPSRQFPDSAMFWSPGDAGLSSKFVKLID